MGFKVRGGREMEYTAEHSALEKIIKKDEFSYNFFTDESLRSKLPAGSRRPNNPQRRYDLYNKAANLANRTRYRAASEIERRRDEAMINLITTKGFQAGTHTVMINGRDYSLLNLSEYDGSGRLTKGVYTYVDVSPGSEFSLMKVTKNDGQEDLPHVLSLTKGDLGPVIVDVGTLRFDEETRVGWRGIDHKEFRELLQTKAAMSANNVNAARVVKKRPVRPQKTEGNPKPTQAAPIDALRTELSAKLRRRNKQAAWAKELTAAAARTKDPKDLTSINIMLLSLECDMHTDIDAKLDLAGAFRHNESDVVTGLRKRANEIRTTGR